MAALESMGKDPLQIGEIPPTPKVVDQFFNDGTLMQEALGMKVMGYGL
jgi:hypothetical protein